MQSQNIAMVFGEAGKIRISAKSNFTVPLCHVENTIIHGKWGHFEEF